MSWTVPFTCSGFQLGTGSGESGVVWGGFPYIDYHLSLSHRQAQTPPSPFPFQRSLAGKPGSSDPRRIVPA